MTRSHGSNVKQPGEPPRPDSRNYGYTDSAYSLDEQAINLTIREQPIFEDESQAKQAMDDMANQLRMVGVPTKPAYVRD